MINNRRVNMASKKILLLEDDPRIALVEKMVLKKAGYEVLHANNAKTAIELASENDIDLLISDLMMPDWDGRMAIKALLQGKPGVKVIVVSAVSDPKVMDEMRNNLDNIDGWFEKPFETSALVAKVKELIG